MPRKKKEITVKASKPKSKQKPKQAIVEEEFRVPSTIKRRKLSHVLTIDNDFYITCNNITFMLKQRVDGVDKNGKKLQDTQEAYATDLKDILNCAVRRMIRVPADFNELSAKLDHIFGLLDARIPPNIKPKDLFADMQVDNDEEMDD